MLAKLAGPVLIMIGLGFSFLFFFWATLCSGRDQKRKEKTPKSVLQAKLDFLPKTFLPKTFKGEKRTQGAQTNAAESLSKGYSFLKQAYILRAPVLYQTSRGPVGEGNSFFTPPLFLVSWEGAGAQWKSVCFLCRRSWLRFPAFPP